MNDEITSQKQYHVNGDKKYPTKLYSIFHSIWNFIWQNRRKKINVLKPTGTRHQAHAPRLWWTKCKTKNKISQWKISIQKSFAISTLLRWWKTWFFLSLENIFQSIEREKQTRVHQNIMWKNVHQIGKGEKTSISKLINFGMFNR